MFTGIIQATARVQAVSEAKKIKWVRIAAPRGWKLPLGASVNVDGICSTVAKKGGGFFEVEYMSETLSKTTAGRFTKGVLLNLERSLKYGQPVDGHLVQGHVDCAAPIREVVHRGSSRELTIKPNAAFARGAMLHGSIAVNGVSLTIAKKHGPNITVALIPYTLKHSNLGSLKAGDTVNVEFDHSLAYLDKAHRR
ncbi:MAG TPA: riboflavin synthase [Candidatus Paceibacterota bacterium]|jgi:riboflavin synthase alpha subunit|nr:riboflavin synthase [Candidatus Paceibacterota bacterium]